ncbi:MAG: helix-turn-helix domain-containing protein [Desulfovibrio sp.]
MLIQNKNISSSVQLLSCEEPEAGFSAHIHEDYCIWLNSGGAELYEYKGNSYTLSAGQFGVLSPGEVHANKGLEGCCRHLQTFYISQEYMNHCAEELGLSAELVFDGKICTDKELFNKLSAVHKYLFTIDDAEGLCGDELLFSNISELLMRHGKDVSRTRPQVWREPDNVFWVEQAKEYFKYNLEEECSLEALARRLGCSRFQLIRNFKKQTGMTPHAYLMQLRVERGRLLLLNGETIPSVALAVGFSDQSHFTRIFRRTWGVTPGAYVRAVSA